jgi:hypothetical protein
MAGSWVAPALWDAGQARPGWRLHLGSEVLTTSFIPLSFCFNLHSREVGSQREREGWRGGDDEGTKRGGRGDKLQCFIRAQRRRFASKRNPFSLAAQVHLATTVRLATSVTSLPAMRPHVCTGQYQPAPDRQRQRSNDITSIPSSILMNGAVRGRDAV